MAMDEEGPTAAQPQRHHAFIGGLRHSLSGKHAVVVGRSAILGKPMAMMLLAANATVTICHSRTQNLADHISRADIVVGAVGKPEFIKPPGLKTAPWWWMPVYHPGGVGDIELAP